MFYIYDCNDKVIGNPCGYKTVRAALAVTRNPRTKVYAYINSVKYEQDNAHLKSHGLFEVCSIRQGE